MVTLRADPGGPQEFGVNGNQPLTLEGTSGRPVLPRPRHRIIGLAEPHRNVGDTMGEIEWGGRYVHSLEPGLDSSKLEEDHYELQRVDVDVAFNRR